MLGISIFRPSGSLVMTDQLKNYKLLLKTTAASFTVNSIAPPLIFSHVNSTSSGYPAALSYPVITKVSPGVWSCSVAIFSVAMRSDTRAAPGTVSVTSYVFGTNDITPSGMGINIGGFVLSSSTSDLPMLIKSEPQIDPNGPGYGLAGYLRTVALPAARGVWAGLISPGYTDQWVQGLGAFGQGFYWPDGYFSSGLPAHWYLPSSTSISSLGAIIPYVSSPQIPQPFRVWLIDSFLYN